MTGETKPRTRDDAPVTSSTTINPAASLIAQAVTINAPAQDLYGFWRDPVNLVQVTDNITGSRHDVASRHDRQMTITAGQAAPRHV